MQLQPASKREVLRVGIGSVACLIGMYAIFLGVLGKLYIGVLLGGLCGTAVAMLNFIALCLTVQAAADAGDQKQMQAKVRLSYNFRLLAQGAWIVTAFLLPWMHTVAAALPLLFPSAVIFIRRKRME